MNTNKGYNPYDNNPFKTDDSPVEFKNEFDAHREIKKGVMWFLLEDPHCEFGNWELED